MKYILIFLTFIFTSINTQAYEGMVLALEVPIYKRPSLDSKVIWKKRKGEKVYIHGNYVEKAPHLLRFEEEKDWRSNFEVESNFFKTLTRDGREGYIEKKFIRVLYNDIREMSAKDDFYFQETDPTDYRLIEPLQKQYPLVRNQKNIALLLYGLRPSNNISYNYANNISSETQYENQGAFAAYAKNVGLNNNGRLFFGVMAQFFNGQKKFTLADQVNVAENFNGTLSATELHLTLGVGPYLHYDIFKKNNYRFSFSGGFMLKHHRIWVEQKLEDKNSDRFNQEQLYFSGLGLSSKIAGQYTYRNIFNINDIDFLASLEGEFSLPYSFKAEQETVLQNIWVDKSYSVPFYGNLTLYFGVRANY